MIYEELVKRLRDFAVELRKAENVLLVNDAANTIEELTAYARQIEELRKDGYYLQKTKMMTYGQATMTEPLPEPPKEESC